MSGSNCVEVKAVSKSQRQRRYRLARGQAMVEYSIVTHALLLVGGGAVLGIAQYLRLFDSLNRYLDGLYFVLSTAAI